MLLNLDTDTILLVYKRLLFNSCNILVSKDEQKLKRTILGLLQLFYPLAGDYVKVPILPDSLREYTSLCDHSIIGVISKENDSKDGSSKIKGKKWFEVYFEVQQDKSCQINIDNSKSIQKPRHVIEFNTKG